jgi:hypothetical protein
MTHVPEAAEVDDLYVLGLDVFTSERNALAKRLRAAGRKDDAARIAAVRRPSAAAWALNQVARRDEAVVGRALDLGATLRTAMAEALAGDATSLRKLRTEERSSVDALVRRATSFLTDAGANAGDPVVRRITDTVRAALADESLGEQLRAGRLDEDHVPTGFGFAGDPAAAPRPRPTPRTEPRTRGAARPPAPRTADSQDAVVETETPTTRRSAHEQEAEAQRARQRRAREQHGRKLVSAATDLEQRAAALSGVAEAAVALARRRHAAAVEAQAAADVANDAAAQADATAADARTAAEVAHAAATAARAEAVAWTIDLPADD